jgi:hypothetical protein
MIETFQNVDDNFYRLFVGDDYKTKALVVKDYRGNLVSANIRFIKSSRDYSEEEMEKYPAVVIANRLPVQRKDINHRNDFEIDNFVDTDTDGEEDKASKVRRALAYEFKYDVSVATKSESESQAFEQYFFNRFDMEEGVFLFNKKPLPLIDPIGDYVPYKIEVDEPIRTDGIFETIFTFFLYPWVDHKPDEQFDLLTSINIGLYQKQ